ncbi:MAG: class I SAM-dependent methyltransferase [Actinomycetota bacterium]
MTDLSPTFPDLEPNIEIDPSAGDLDALWDRFEVFEAIHHSQRICNPMTEAELDEVMTALAPEPGQRWLDLGCGSGELLIRAREGGVSAATGWDLSPWMLNTASREGSARLGAGTSPRWILGNGASSPTAAEHDVAVCVGAEWIWHGMRGTIAALRDRVTAGGQVAFGGPRLHFDADPTETSRTFGTLDTVADVEDRLVEVGFSVRNRIDPGEAGWLAYLERGRRDVMAWAQRHPGPRADRWLADMRDWVEAYERDRTVVGWSIWIADTA